MPAYSNVIAVIDDDEVFLLLVKKMIEQKNAADMILQFSNGSTALTYFKNNASDILQLPSVIFLDINMPGMSGWQVLEKLSCIEFSPDYESSVFIMSADDIDFEKMRNYPLIKGYISKPAVPGKLMAAIESVKTVIK